MSERPRNTLLRSSDGSLKLVNRGKKMLGRNFENPKFGDVLGSVATTCGATVKMSGTIGFSVSNRPGNTLPWSSDCSCGLLNRW